MSQRPTTRIFRNMLCAWVAFLPALSPCAKDLKAATYAPGKVSFSIRFKDEVTPYHTAATFVLPGEVLSIEIVDAPRGRAFTLQASSGEVAAENNARWRWTAPGETGLYPLKIAHAATGETVILNAFVMVPFSQIKNGTLNGYRIDEYPRIPLKQLELYKPPAGFVEVTPENENTPVSPHFKLKHFLCKQNSGHPKYLVLRERLLLKLELILEKVNEKGYPCTTLEIMSGYRTPYYNRAIGNVRWSRHVWGGAADFYIDESPRDGTMDDLNKDGKINARDAAVLYDLIDAMFGQPWYRPFVGGLGQYEKTAVRGPFVHIDVRGARARWGH